MAIKSLEQRKRQQILLIIALALLIIAGLILYFSFWKGGGVIEEAGETGLISSGPDQRLKAIDLDFDFLEQTVLPFLKIHGQIPVEKGQTGRANPFIPY